MSNENSQVQAYQSVYSSMAAFDDAQRVCKVLAGSDLVPKLYKGNIANCLVALEMANRMGLSPLMVMQNLNIISNRPSFGSAFLIATINTCGRFSPLSYEMKSLGKKKVDYTVKVGEYPNQKKEARTIEIDNFECIAVATDKSSGQLLKGPAVTCEMAVREGWWTKSDSKWPVMTDLMLRYRAAAFFVRTYAPELSMGMHTAEEVQDAYVVEVSTAPNRAAAAQKFNVPAEQSPATVATQQPTAGDEFEDIVPENDAAETPHGDDLI